MRSAENAGCSFNPRTKRTHKPHTHIHMNESQIKLIEEIKELALANYDEGGDIIIECLEDSEILEYMSSIKEAKEFMKLKAEQRREIESTIW